MAVVISDCYPSVIDSVMLNRHWFTMGGYAIALEWHSHLWNLAYLCYHVNEPSVHDSVQAVFEAVFETVVEAFIKAVVEAIV